MEWNVLGSPFSPSRSDLIPYIMIQVGYMAV
jgi:hypothetical protein